MITLTEQTDGSLLVTLNKGCKGDLKRIIKNAQNTDLILVDLLEESGYLDNNWDAPCNFPLTEAPIITYCAIYETEEDDEPTDYEKVWYYSEYMIKSFAKELKKNKQVILTSAI
jgi:hypothetical protein